MGVTEPSEAGSEPVEADHDTGPIQLPGYGLTDSDAFEEAPTPPSGSPSAWPHAVSPLLPPFPLPPAPPVPPPPVAGPPPPVAGPPPNPGSPAPLPPRGSPRTERGSVVALFLVHMFPIGHLPVAMDKPARQLPLPDDPEGFPPNDHPDARLIFDDQALTNVTAGTQNITAIKTGYLSHTLAVSVTGGATSTLNIPIATAGKISVKVVTSSGAAVSGATVTIKGGVISTTVSGSSSSTGLFTTNWIPVGTYTVTVAKSGFTTQSKTTTVSSGATTSLTFTGF